MKKDVKCKTVKIYVKSKTVKKDVKDVKSKTAKRVVKNETVKKKT